MSDDETLRHIDETLGRIEAADRTLRTEVAAATRHDHGPSVAQAIMAASRMHSTAACPGRQLEQAFVGYRPPLPPLPAWRLPRQSGDLLADVRALRRAQTLATTADQRAACALRSDQLTERMEVALKPMVELIAQTAERFVGIGRVVGEGLSQAFRPLVEAAALVEDARQREQSARDRALEAKRKFGRTGPVPRRLDGRKR